MNLWLRLLWLLATAWRRPPVVPPSGSARIRFRVWPHDLDTSLHMNNGRYWTLMDLGRLDIMLRSGLLGAVLRNGWTPIVSAGAIRFRRELRPFRAFELETRIVYWDETRFVIEQRFRSGPEGRVAATGFVLAGIYDRKRKGFVPAATLFELAGVDAVAPDMTAEIEAFLGTEDAMRLATAGR